MVFIYDDSPWFAACLPTHELRICILTVQHWRTICSVCTCIAVLNFIWCDSLHCSAWNINGDKNHVVGTMYSVKYAFRTVRNHTVIISQLLWNIWFDKFYFVFRRSDRNPQNVNTSVSSECTHESHVHVFRIKHVDWITGSRAADVGHWGCLGEALGGKLNMSNLTPVKSTNFIMPSFNTRVNI